MGKEIELSVNMVGQSAIIGIAGDVTAATGASVEETYNRDDVQCAERIVMEFNEECYINSGGLAFLIDIASKSRKKGQMICVTGLSDHFVKIFKMVGLTRCLEIFPTVEDALK
jgi:anti-anti-sigma factor